MSRSLFVFVAVVGYSAVVFASPMMDMPLVSPNAGSVSKHASHRELEIAKRIKAALVARSMGGALGVKEPSSGLGFIIPGAIMTGVGALNLAAMPVCVADFYVASSGRSGSDMCLIMSGVVGVGLLGVGIPLLIVGIGKRSKHRAWEEEFGTLAFVPVPGGMSFGWTRSF